MQSSVRLLFVLGLCGGAGAAGSCARSDRAGPLAAGSGARGGQSVAAVGTGGTGGDARLFVDASSGGSPPGDGCSPDLHHVVGANGDIVQDCGPAEGCAGGECTDACAAAAASKRSIG
jgi:hypothetical protein